MLVFCGSDFSHDASPFTLLRRAASVPFFTRVPSLVAPALGRALDRLGFAEAGAQRLGFIRSFEARHPCRFSLASGRASVFSLRGHCAAGAARTAKLARRAEGRSPESREGTKSKATPIQRSPGSCPTTTQRDSGGSPTVHPWTGVELGAIHCAHPAGSPYVTLPLHRGPGCCASCAAKTKRIPACLSFALAFPSPARREKVPQADEGAFDFDLGAHDARYMGPLDRGETAQATAWMQEVEQRREQLPEMSEGWPTRCGPVRRQSRDGLSANPAAGSRTWSTGTVRKSRVSGWPSLCLLSLGHARESKTLAMEGEWKTTGSLHTQREQMQTMQSHWTPACAGATSGERRVKPRRGCRAPKERAFSVQRHWAPACAGATSGKRRATNGQGFCASSKRIENKSARRAGQPK